MSEWVEIDNQRRSEQRRRGRLKVVRSVHTLIWIFFVACIVGIPLAAWQDRYVLAQVLFGLVAGEVLVLMLNRRRCPLTAIAARYTEDRSPNFDIYLPAWLARHNQLIFGALYLAGSAYALLRWSLTAA